MEAGGPLTAWREREWGTGVSQAHWLQSSKTLGKLAAETRKERAAGNTTELEPDHSPEKPLPAGRGSVAVSFAWPGKAGFSFP
jgi:hypothetical protein